MVTEIPPAMNIIPWDGVLHPVALTGVKAVAVYCVVQLVAIGVGYLQQLPGNAVYIFGGMAQCIGHAHHAALTVIGIACGIAQWVCGSQQIPCLVRAIWWAR